MDSSLSSPESSSTSAILQSPPAAQPFLSGLHTAPIPSSKIGPPAMGIDSSFLNGTPASSNSQTLYIHVDPHQNFPANGSGAGGSEFWVTVPWSKVESKLLEHPSLVLSVLSTLKNSPVMRNRALRILGSTHTENGNASPTDFSLFPSASPPIGINTNVSLFTPANNDPWKSPSDYGHPAQFHGNVMPVGLALRVAHSHRTNIPLFLYITTLRELP